MSFVCAFVKGQALVFVTASGDRQGSMAAWLWAVPQGAKAGARPREKHERSAAVEGLAVTARFTVRSAGRWLFCLRAAFLSALVQTGSGCRQALGGMNVFCLAECDH